MKLGNEDSLHVFCAVRSGIPLCCIKFWMEEWEDFIGERRITHHINVPKETQYVPCPKCIEKRHFVSIRICDKEDFKTCGVRLCRDCRIKDEKRNLVM